LICLIENIDAVLIEEITDKTPKGWVQGSDQFQQQIEK
jgi:hypothetical protein